MTGGLLAAIAKWQTGQDVIDPVLRFEECFFGPGSGDRQEILCDVLLVRYPTSGDECQY